MSSFLLLIQRHQVVVSKYQSHFIMLLAFEYFLLVELDVGGSIGVRVLALMDTIPSVFGNLCICVFVYSCIRVSTNERRCNNDQIFYLHEEHFILKIFRSSNTKDADVFF